MKSYTKKDKITIGQFYDYLSKIIEKNPTVREAVVGKYDPIKGQVVPTQIPMMWTQGHVDLEIDPKFDYTNHFITIH